MAGANVVEVHFDREDEAWQGRLEKMEGVTAVHPEGSGFYRVITQSGSKTTMEIVGLAASLGETLTSLSVQNTTLDDVFIHYTGRQLRDEAVKAGLHHAAAAGSAAMNRMMAIVEREMRKFFRSPMLMIMSLMMPILQLVIIGNAFGGKIVGTHVAVVDYDHGPEAVKVREAFDAVAANIKTFTTTDYENEVQAREDVRTGKIDAAVIIPAQYSRRVYSQDAPKLGFVVDNSDLFTSSALEGEMQSLVDAMNAPQIQDRLAKTIELEIVELYPYVNYLKYLLPMTVALAMYISVMIGGGMLYIDDKARGVHEGYLVTPITKFELVFGLNIAGAIKAVLSGVCLTVIGSLIAGLGIVFHPIVMLQILCLIVAGSIAFNGMMFLLMVRVDDPLVPRAMFGILNVLLLYPSGAMYPTSSFPRWMQAIGVVDPFTYVIHGFKAVMLKNGGWVAIEYDLLFLMVFGITTLLVATPLFKRTL